MKTVAAAVVLASVCSLCRWAQAEEKSGVDLGVHVGYAIPLGAAIHSGSDSSFSQLTAGAVPIGVDLSYRVEPMLSVGVYGQYGFGFVSNDTQELCDDLDLRCSVNDVRAGVQAAYIASFPGIDTWAALTLGVERFSTSSEGSNSGGSVLMTLPDFGAKGGVNFEVAPAFAIGPFVALSMGRFSYASVHNSGQSAHIHIQSDERRFHQWLTLGLRGVFTP